MDLFYLLGSNQLPSRHTTDISNSIHPKLNSDSASQNPTVHFNKPPSTWHLPLPQASYPKHPTLHLSNKIFEHLLYTRHCSKDWNTKYIKFPIFVELTFIIAFYWFYLKYIFQICLFLTFANASFELATWVISSLHCSCSLLGLATSLAHNLKFILPYGNHNFERQILWCLSPA